MIISLRQLRTKILFDILLEQSSTFIVRMPVTVGPVKTSVTVGPIKTSVTVGPTSDRWADQNILIIAANC